MPQKSNVPLQLLAFLLHPMAFDQQSEGAAEDPLRAQLPPPLCTPRASDRYGIGNSHNRKSSRDQQTKKVNCGRKES